jgi:hypothetical protein
MDNFCASSSEDGHLFKFVVEEVIAKGTPSINSHWRNRNMSTEFRAVKRSESLSRTETERFRKPKKEANKQLNTVVVHSSLGLEMLHNVRLRRHCIRCHTATRM